MIADYVPESAERTVKMIKEVGGEASCIAADVSVTRQVEMMVDKTVETYGRLDGAFNNAGIEGKMADTAEYPEDVFDRIIAINLKGVWLCMKYEIPQMLKDGEARSSIQHRVRDWSGLPSFLPTMPLSMV